MKPIKQTRLYDPSHGQPPGNCWAACIATILELELDELPDEKDFWQPGQPPRKTWPPFYAAMIAWLAERNLTLIEVRVDNIEIDWGDSYEILSGTSPRNKDILHSVVGFGGKIVHDPHPSGDGLLEGDGAKPWTRSYFVVCNPAKLLRREV